MLELLAVCVRPLCVAIHMWVFRDVMFWDCYWSTLLYLLRPNSVQPQAMHALART